MSDYRPHHKSHLITPTEVAGILGVKVETLCVWRSVGRYALPYVKSGSKVFYKPEDVEAFIESRTYGKAASHE